MISYALKQYKLKELICVAFDEYFWSFLKHVPGLEGVWLRRLYLKTFSNTCGSDLIVERNVFIRSSSNLSIGSGVFINRDVHIAAKGGVVIGDQVAIGPKVTIITNDHRFLVRGTEYQGRDFSMRKVTIGDNTIIGSNSYINAGVTIGSNCVISAGTNVNIDIPDNTAVSGQVLDLFHRNMKKSLRSLKP